MSKYIITADWHTRKDKPRCRLDEDWMDTQRQAIRFVFDTAEERKAAVANVGDIFHRSSVPPEVLNMLLMEIKGRNVEFYILAGNHDLLYHNVEYLHRSSYLNLLLASDGEDIVELRYIGNAGHYGEEIKRVNDNGLYFIHRFVYADKEDFYSRLGLGISAKDLLDKHKDAKFIFTGDNHRKFVYEDKGRFVINPGCLLRQTADLKDYEPCIYFVDTDTGEYEAIPVPDNGEFVTDEYLRDSEGRDERIGAFVESLKKSENMSMSFKDNLLNGLKENKVEEEVKEIIYEILEEV